MPLRGALNDENRSNRNTKDRKMQTRGLFRASLLSLHCKRSESAHRARISRL